MWMCNRAIVCGNWRLKLERLHTKVRNGGSEGRLYTSVRHGGSEERSIDMHVQPCRWGRGHLHTLTTIDGENYPAALGLMNLPICLLSCQHYHITTVMARPPYILPTVVEPSPPRSQIVLLPEAYSIKNFVSLSWHKLHTNKASFQKMPKI